MNYRWNAGRGSGPMPVPGASDFGIKIEERVQAGFELLLDLLPASFEHVHGDVRLASVLQLQSGVVNFRDFLRRKQPQPVNQSEICHEFIVVFPSSGPSFCCYNSAVFRKILFAALPFLPPFFCFAQQSGSAPPEVKVHVLNVCAPSAEENREISGALARIPRRPSFSPDFEVDRGRSLIDQSAALIAGVNTAQLPPEDAGADFVRIRREFSGDNPYLNVQYSFSRDSRQMVETLVFRMRDPREILQVSIEDSASAVTSPAAMLGSGTPASRIKLERFGKSSVVLARCLGQQGSPAPDQSAYEPVFASASGVLSDYRNLLGARRTVPDELGRIDLARKAASTSRQPAARVPR
jgi:hypothetical protein